MDFLYTAPPIMVMPQSPRAVKVLKIVLKVVQEDFNNTCKNYIDFICRFFTNFSTVRGIWGMEKTPKISETT